MAINAELAINALTRGLHWQDLNRPYTLQYVNWWLVMDCKLNIAINASKIEHPGKEESGNALTFPQKSSLWTGNRVSTYWNSSYIWTELSI